MSSSHYYRIGVQLQGHLQMQWERHDNYMDAYKAGHAWTKNPNATYVEVVECKRIESATRSGWVTKRHV